MSTIMIRRTAGQFRDTKDPTLVWFCNAGLQEHGGVPAQARTVWVTATKHHRRGAWKVTEDARGSTFVDGVEHTLCSPYYDWLRGTVGFPCYVTLEYDDTISPAGTSPAGGAGDLE